MHKIETFLTLETQVWQALVDGDARADIGLLTKDFLGVYPSGFANRGDHVGQLDAGPVMLWFKLAQYHMIEVDDENVLFSYQASYQRVDGATEVMYVSSLWQMVDGAWRNSFSQDTPALAAGDN